MYPFKLHFVTASSFQWSKGFNFSPTKATMTKFGKLAWSNLTVYL